jgi:hypothetical protein
VFNLGSDLDQTIEQNQNIKNQQELDFEKDIKTFFKGLLSEDKEYFLEIKLIEFSFISLISLAFIIGSFILLVQNPSLIGNRMPFLGYIAISSVLITLSLAHVNAHRNVFTCMEGMMVGMTIGMISGLVYGFIIGATNGMFIGSVYGLAIGMLVGAWAGKCCGIMGVMEGLMAGLMGGIMGAMTSVMLISDNLLLFTPLFLFSCFLILLGLIFMVHQAASKRDKPNIMPFSQFISLVLLFFILTIFLAFFGPRGGIVI